MGLENPVHLIFIAAVALIVLGPKRLPEIARALGNGIREFRESVSQDPAPHVPPPAVHQNVAQPAPPYVQAPASPYVSAPAPQESAAQQPAPEDR
jgi:sec-independent protein translocase protein TatA